jgi:hypothetical protein
MTDGNDEYKRRHCGNCEGETEQRKLGTVPAYLVLSEEGINQEVARTCFCNATACTGCGAVRPLFLNDEQLSNGEEKMVETLADEFPERSEEIKASLEH